MYTREQVRKAMSLPRGISNTQLRRTYRQRRIHCYELQLAIDEGRAPCTNTFPSTTLPDLDPKTARALGLHWCLVTYRHRNKARSL